MLAIRGGSGVGIVPSDHSWEAGLTMGARILAVDDAADLRGYLVRFLKFKKYDVREAGLAAEALALLAEDPLPDLILLDVMMPGMSGPEMLAAMRRAPRTARVPV